MRKVIQIGEKEFKYKKDALQHYKRILNSYNFGQSLTNIDFNDVLDLLDYDLKESFFDDTPNEDLFLELENDIFEIIDVKVSKVQFNTKCFEVFYEDESSEYISYLMIINKKSFSRSELFNIACRNIIQEDLKQVKQTYFDIHSVKGKVKCQETGKLSKWIDLVVDHRQPNTFSVIIDRFKELNNIEVENLRFITNEHNLTIFEDQVLLKKFRNYHKEKANLRIVRKECNASRSGLARVKSSSKDLKII